MKPFAKGDETLPIEKLTISYCKAFIASIDHDENNTIKF